MKERDEMSATYATEQEIIEMLTKIFPPKPDPIASELPAEMTEVIEIAKELGVTLFPPVVFFDNHDAPAKCSCVNFHDYSKTTIEIVTHGLFQIERTNSEMARSLAHELGHCKHIQEGKGTYETWGFKKCEDYASSFADEVMSRASFDIVRNDW
jgi:hypothetical protein